MTIARQEVARTQKPSLGLYGAIAVGAFFTIDYAIEGVHSFAMAMQGSNESTNLYTEWINRMVTNCRFPLCNEPSAWYVTKGWGLCVAHAETFEFFARPRS